MDSGCGGDCQEEAQMCKNDGVGNANESVKETVPKILSPELHDIFPMFTNMLDVKSFMNLAMASKEMYKRCMEDNAIKVNVYVKHLMLKKENGSLVFSWHSWDDDYAVARKLPRKISLTCISTEDNMEASDWTAVRRYLKEIGVCKITKFFVISGEITDWEAVLTIIKDMKVEIVMINGPIENDILRSILQLNIRGFCYNGPVPIDFILEVDSPIRQMYFSEVNRITKEELLQILSKINAGSLLLQVGPDAVDWNEFDMLPFDHQGPLPEHRPLLLARISDKEKVDEYWFLHADGGVTKCIKGALDGTSKLDMFKCEPNDYPWILRKEEDILKDLAEKRRRISCTGEQFRSFFMSLAMLDFSHDGPLPKDRPLFIKYFDYFFWMLDEEDNLTICYWVDGSASWKPFDTLCCQPIWHPALAKHMLLKLVKELKRPDLLFFHCTPFGSIDGFFDCLQTLDFEYSGPLPSERPLVFEWTPRDDNVVSYKDGNSWKHNGFQVILLEDRLLELNYNSENPVLIRLCPYFDIPPVLFTAENIVDMLRDEAPINRNFGVHLRDIISEKTETEFWFMYDGVVRKIEWIEGRLSNCEADLCESPPNFMKQVFKHFAEKQLKNSTSFKLELEQFRNCLEQFSVVPFDYSGPLKSDSPLAFVKNETHHTCRKGATTTPRCDCSDSCVRVWFVWDGIRVTHCSWGKEEPRNVVFGQSADFNDVPLVLKSKEYLKNLMQGKYDESSCYDWFGRFDELLACLNECAKLPFDFDGPLPEERPLLFENDSNEEQPAVSILCEDETVIECMKKSTSHISMSLSSNYEQLPPSLRSLL